MNGTLPSWHQRLLQATEFHQQGRYVEAIAGYHAVLSLRPDNADALHLMGMALEQAGQAEKGKAFVELAIRADPQISAYRNSLGNIYKALSDLPAAEAAYADAVRLDPANTEAHNNLGMLAQGKQDWEAASRHFRAALEADGGYVAARFNLAVTDWLAGRQDVASDAFREILPRAPAFAIQLTHLAIRTAGTKDAAGAECLRDIIAGHDVPVVDRQVLTGALAALHGDTEAAEAACRSALAFDPDHTEALGFLGKLLLERKAEADAVPFLERLVALKPHNLPAITGLGYALSRSGAHERAIAMLQQAVAINPAHASAWWDIGQSLSKLDRFDEACDAYRRAIAIDPEMVDSYVNLAEMEAQRGNLEAAEAACHEGLKRNPQSVGARGNLAFIRSLQKRFAEAEELYLALLSDKPEDGTAHNNLGLMLLKLGRYSDGWPHFHSRWQSAKWNSRDRSAGLPRWEKDRARDGKVLIWREQGIGDEILFSSLIPDLVATGADVVLATTGRLVPLFGRSFPSIEVVLADDGFDPAAKGITSQRPIADLGSLFRPSTESFAQHPAVYLQADPEMRSRLQARYRAGAAADGLFVGVSWSSRNPNTGRFKSVDLSQMAPLLAMPGFRLISLQYGPVADDIARFTAKTGLEIIHDPEVDPMLSIEAQAAQIAGLDLVVTVSTTAAHLAAALGIPTLILLPDERGQLWYWGHTGDRTPWYPQVRICRGELGESVESLVARAQPALQAMLERVRHGSLAPSP